MAVDTVAGGSGIQVSASTGDVVIDFEPPAGTQLPGNPTLVNVVSTALGVTSQRIASVAYVRAVAPPAGGAIGQVLAKRTAVNFEYEWVNQSGGPGGPVTAADVSVAAATPIPVAVTDAQEAIEDIYARGVFLANGGGGAPPSSGLPAGPLVTSDGSSLGSLALGTGLSATGTFPSQTLIATLQINDAAASTTAVYSSNKVDGELSAIGTRIDGVQNLGHYAGAFNTRAAVPTNTSGFPQGITVNDFITVRADETQGGVTTRYVASGITGGVITWTYDVTYSTDISGKMDLVPAATNGHLATFNASGQVVDGGAGDSRYLQLSGGALTAGGAITTTATTPGANDLVNKTYVDNAVAITRISGGTF